MWHILDFILNSEFMFQVIYTTNFNSKESRSYSYLIIYVIYWTNFSLSVRSAWEVLWVWNSLIGHIMCIQGFCVIWIKVIFLQSLKYPMASSDFWRPVKVWVWECLPKVSRGHQQTWSPALPCSALSWLPNPGLLAG